MKGKKVPAIGRIEISIIEESNPRLLAFQKRELDIANPVPPDLIGNVLEPGNRLKPELAAQGITLVRGIQPSITFEYFNMDDPVVGGYAKEKDRAAASDRHGVQHRRGGQDRAAGTGAAGDADDRAQPDRPRPDVRRSCEVRSPDREGAARPVRLRRQDGDGWRDLPDGKPFTLQIAS